MATHATPSREGEGAPQKKSRAPSTRRALAFREIRENAVIMKDGSLRAVLAVSSINFALKSVDEQRAIVAAYVQFLNALDYPLQIVIHSRKLDVDPYLRVLREREDAESNELLKAQMADYRSFVTELVTLGEIMTKTFYVTVPYSTLSDRRKKFLDRFREALSPARIVQLKETKFRAFHQELLQRVGHVQGALHSLGLQAVQLDTQALMELFYELYNPVIGTNEPIGTVGELQVET